MGVKREFGNGQSLDISRDPWLVDVHPRAARAKPTVPYLNLSQLLDQHSDQWNIQNLLYFFDKDECQRILQIKSGGVESSSNYTWIHNASGVYSVKSGFWLWSTSHLNHSLAIKYKPNFSEIFQKTWAFSYSSKVRNFIWRCLTSSLSVGIEIRKKRISEDASCRLCGFEKEDVNHLLFQCDLAHEIWSLSSMSSLFADGISNSLYQNIWTCLNAATASFVSHTDDAHLGPWILWFILKARNEFIFDKCTTSALNILNRAKVAAHEWMQHNVLPVKSPSIQVITPTLAKWIAPPISYLKCIVDATWQDSNDRCGVSWILKDHSGHVRLYGIKVYPRLLSSLEAEATAMVWAVNCIWNMGYDNVIFESDSSTLINAIVYPSTWPRLLSFTTEIHGIASRRPWNITFDNISRTKNVAADALAKHVLSFPIYFGLIDNSLPSWLEPSLEC